MPSPVTSEDFTINSLSLSVCEAFKKLLATSTKLKLFFQWMFNTDGTVTDSFLSELNGVFVPIGNVMFRPIDSLPTGWLNCNGQEVSRTTYASLYATIGDSFGVASNPDNFKLPNYRDVFLLGAGSSRAPGATGGSETHTLTLAETPAHDHGMPLDAGGMRTTTAPGIGNNNDDANTGQSVYAVDTFESAGGGAAHNNMPPYKTGLWIIKF